MANGCVQNVSDEFIYTVNCMLDQMQSYESAHTKVKHIHKIMRYICENKNILNQPEFKILKDVVITMIDNNFEAESDGLISRKKLEMYRKELI